MIRRTVTIAATLVGIACLVAGVPAPARGDSRNAAMRANLMAIRGLIERAGADRYFNYPQPTQVRRGGLKTTWWPADPWTGTRMTPGDSRGHYSYTLLQGRRSYRLTGYLNGRTIVLRGGMPHSAMLAYDHRGEEGLNLIRQYVESWARGHHGLYPLAADVAGDGAVRLEPQRRYWPSNPWDHGDMAQRRDRGSFAYTVATDRSSYTLRLHRALKNDYVIRGATLTDPWRLVLAGLEDEILRRGGRILAGYVDQWALQHGGELPAGDELAAGAAVGTAHAHWPSDPIDGAAMRPGRETGDYVYVPGADGAYTLTIHLRTGVYQAGGTAPTAP